MAELSTLARPYAKAAFKHAADAGALQDWSKMLATAAAVSQHDAVERLLASPTHTAAQQAETVIDVCGDALNESGRNFVHTLSANRRLPLLAEVSRQFEVLKAGLEKNLAVEVTSAGEVSSEQQDKLAAALKSRLGHDVTLQVEVDKSLLGGAVIRAGDTVLDGSVRGRLAKLAEALNS
ncbi:F0F1 ATP synthase subunit delta [Porticoccus sp. W117]|uniref:F0F1 ATP synthase subunit delta n=1 Tax=Porticoccus sp. W117 TaxID=3054777 RepID=UPI0025930420|nr:F0F1 ATP synthase subunit delta [Porticoccus sp. W117]MDM3870790.1 F0F1 ATP synthase subunit delta [Porticoccus sp. W117]